MAVADGAGEVFGGVVVESDVVDETEELVDWLVLAGDAMSDDVEGFF